MDFFNKCDQIRRNLHLQKESGLAACFSTDLNHLFYFIKNVEFLYFDYDNAVDIFQNSTDDLTTALQKKKSEKALR